MDQRSKRKKAQRSKARKRTLLISTSAVLGTCLIAGAVYAGTLYFKAERALDQISASGSVPGETAGSASLPRRLRRPRLLKTKIRTSRLRFCWPVWTTEAAAAGR